MTIEHSGAVIWDMDGVIADTGKCHYQSWYLALKKQGIDFSEQDFQHIFGQRNDSIVRQFIGQDVSLEKIEEVSKDKEDFFRAEIVKDLRPFPGVLKLLKVLKENHIRSAIASSAPLKNVQVIVQGLGIQEYFQAVVYGQEVKAGKPSPEVFLLAARKLEAETRKCIVIEDATAGVQAACKAGMRCIAVTNTHPAESLQEADLIVNTLEKVGLREINRLLAANK